MYIQFLSWLVAYDERKFGSFISSISSKMESSERFQFLRTYLDSLDKLAEADEVLAKELAWKIIQYWIKWEDENSWNPIIEAMFVQIKLMIDNGKEITERNKENWKKWWRPKNQNKTEIKPNDNQNETELKPKKTKIENRKDKIENNLLSLSKDKGWTEVQLEEEKYWKEEVNECLELIKSYNWWIIDWTIKNQRRYANMLVNKLEKLESVKEWKFTRYDTLEIILKVISQNKYYAPKITSPENIFRNLSILMQQCKVDISKASSSSIVLQSI